MSEIEKVPVISFRTGAWKISPHIPHIRHVWNIYHDHRNRVDFFVAGSTDEVLVRITNLCPQLLDTKEVF